MTAIAAIAAQQISANSAAGASSLLDARVGAAGASNPYGSPFAGVLKSALETTQKLETNAASAVAGLVSGKGVDVHTAMIATEKSNLAFEMMLSFRNKAVSAYQQLMGLQF